MLSLNINGFQLDISNLFSNIFYNYFSKRTSMARVTTIIKEKNIKTLKNVDIYEELLTTIEEKNPFNYDTFSKHLNELIITLKININEMSKYISFDSSHISRIRYGKTKPTDPISLSNKIANFIESKYQEKNNLNQLSLLLDKDINKENLSKEILNYLTSDETINTTNNIDKLLDSINDFNLNDYINKKCTVNS